MSFLTLMNEIFAIEDAEKCTYDALSMVDVSFELHTRKPDI